MPTWLTGEVAVVPQGQMKELFLGGGKRQHPGARSGVEQALAGAGHVQIILSNAPQSSKPFRASPRRISYPPGSFPGRAEPQPAG